MKRSHLLLLGLPLVSACLEADATDPQPVEREGHVNIGHACGPAGEGEARCFAHIVTDANGNPNATSAPGGFGPADLVSAYKVPASSSTLTVAIVDAYGYSRAESDLATYRAQFGLPPCTTAN